MNAFTHSDTDVLAHPMPEQASAPTDPVFVLHGPQQQLVTSGVAQTLYSGPLQELAARSAAILSQLGKAEQNAPCPSASVDRPHAQPPSILVGGLPFSQQANCQLYQPQTRWNWGAYLQQAQQNEAANGAEAHPQPPLHIQAQPSRQGYVQMVERATALLASSNGRYADLRKVVLARTLVAHHAAAPLPVHRLLAQLAVDPSVTAYSLPLDVAAPSAAPATATAQPIAQGHLVGASPELLLSRQGAQIHSHPLAGSARRTGDSRDLAAQQQLLRSAKDLQEHRLVVEFIADVLTPYCHTLVVPDLPGICATASMWHLGTAIEGTLKHPDDLGGSSSLALAALLQPTPALGGTPREQAYALIDELEPFERGFFGGAVGWCNAQGEGSWHVAIRCAEMTATQTRLFAGAGIVQASVAQDEAAETRAKFQAMVNALGWQHAMESLEVSVPL